MNITLLERIQLQNKRTSGNDITEMVHSIASNLSLIFSTNRGAAEIAEEYGRPDMNNIELSLFDSIQQIRTEIEETVILFEPRIHEPVVELVQESISKMELQLYISGLIAHDRKKVHIRYLTVFSVDGTFRVETL